MIAPKDPLLVITCDGCNTALEYTGWMAANIAHTLPPPGWAEIRGYVQISISGPPERLCLNRHLCPDCDIDIGRTLRTCGLDVEVVTPLAIASPPSPA